MIPFITAITNRLWRGEGQLKRWQWLAFMVTLAGLTSKSRGTILEEIELLASWFLFFAGYAILPWQAMFSAIHGQAPSRADSKWFNWMQTLALWITRPKVPNYYVFGMVYGAIRALWMVPGIIALCYVLHSWLPLVGLAGLLMGVVYYFGGKMSRHENLGNGSGVMFAELMMGYWIGYYIEVLS